jgi:mannose/fructose-specific phosphotransferase system component IIA
MAEQSLQTIGAKILKLRLKETDPIEGLSDRLDQAIQEVNDGDGVLILVDLFGASPFNVSARLTQKYKNVQVVTGINLPMLPETALQREGQT